MTYDEFVTAAVRRRAENLERAGQAAMNVLQEERPDIAEKINGTHLDPFQANHWFDHPIPEFLRFVSKEWEDGS